MDWNLIGTIIAAILTLMVYSYLIGDNFVFRLTEHILVGVSVGWAALQVIFGLIVPTISNVAENLSGFKIEFFVFLIPLVLGAVLLTRPLRASKPLTNLVMGLVIGTVAALSLGGALSGTLLPQIGSSIAPLNSGGDIFGRIVLLLGTLVTLWYFQFTILKSNRPGRAAGLALVNERVRLLGRWSIMLAFGAVFAAVFLTYFAALVDRLLFLINIRF